MMIPRLLYKEIISVLPIACVDVVIRDDNGRFLLVKRRNEPLKGEWWVVGGRLLHGERAVDAARRKVREEIGASIGDTHMLGYYEDFFDRNSLGVERTYHTISLVFEAVLPTDSEITIDEQSTDWKWVDKLPARLIIFSPRI